MDCPACKNKLTSIIIVNVQVLACENGCGGLWFSQSQVKMLKNLKPGSGLLLLKINRVDGIKIYHKVENICPYCKTTLLFRHFFSKEFDSEVNQCAKCGGFWFYVAGFSKIQAMNSQQKQKAVYEYFSSIFYEKIKNIHIINEDVAKAVKNITHIFKFLCPEEDFPK